MEIETRDNVLKEVENFKKRIGGTDKGKKKKNKTKTGNNEKESDTNIKPSDSETTSDDCLMRPLCCELNLLTQSDGSAMVCEGKTSMIVSVYGPVEVKAQKLQIDRATVETYYKPRSGQGGVSDRVIELFLKNIFDVMLYTNYYPRTAITVIVQEMQDDGGKLSCAANACCLALINSGLAMKFLTAAVTCMLIKDPLSSSLRYTLDASSCYIDPIATFTFVFENVNYNIVASHTSGSFSDEEYHEANIRCKAASEKIFDFYRSVVKKYSEKIGKKINMI